MTWVRSEYAGELAVLSAWIAALLPWNITYAGQIEGLPGSALFVRFPFVQVRYLFGVPFADAVTVNSPIGARELADPGWSNRLLDLGSVTGAYDLWLVGGIVLALALALSFAMYVQESAVEAALPAPSVRVMGTILAVGTVLLASSTLLFYWREPFGGIPVPIGLVVLAVLSGVLLTAELEQGSDGEQSVQ